jgi:hypothetical protein
MKWTEQYSMQLGLKTEVSELRFVDANRVYIGASPDFQLVDVGTGGISHLPDQVVVQLGDRQVSANVADWACL